MIAGCGSTADLPTPAPGPPPTVTVPAGMPVVLAVAGRFDGQLLRLLQDQIAVFETANDDIVVELVQLKPEAAERREELISRLRAGDSSIDVLVLDLPWLAEFSAAGWLVPLQSYTRTLDVVPGELLTSTVEATTFRGQWTALPWTANGGVLYYRRDLLDKHGYSLSAMVSPGNAKPVSWSELEQLALEVSTKEGLPYGFVWQGAANETLTCSTLEFVWPTGGSVIDAEGGPTLNTREVQAGLRQMEEMVRSGASPVQLASFSEDESLAAFRAGDAVLMRNWVYAWQRLNAEDSPVAGQVGMAPLPASCLGGQALALSAYSLQQRAALRFMAFLTSRDMQAAAAREVGLAPVRVDVYREIGVTGDEPWITLYPALVHSRARPVTPVYDRLSRLIYTEVHRMLAGEQDAATTAAKMQRQAESLNLNGDNP